jgi:hypothetical protein
VTSIALPPHIAIAACRYAISELQSDVDRLIAELPESEREAKKTQFAIFVGAPWRITNFEASYHANIRCLQCTINLRKRLGNFRLVSLITLAKIFRTNGVSLSTAFEGLPTI